MAMLEFQSSSSSSSHHHSNRRSAQDLFPFVIDTGTQTIRAGAADEENDGDPTTIIRSLVARPKNSSSSANSTDSCFFTGSDALGKCLLNHNLRHAFNYSSPFLQNNNNNSFLEDCGFFINDWEAMEQMWSSSFADLLAADCIYANVLLSQKELPPKSDDGERYYYEYSGGKLIEKKVSKTEQKRYFDQRQKIAEIFFEKFNVHGISFFSDAVLSLLNQGTTDGVVIDSGHFSTRAAVIKESKIASDTIPIFTTEICGYATQHNLIKCILENGKSLESLLFYSGSDNEHNNNKYSQYGASTDSMYHSILKKNFGGRRSTLDFTMFHHFGQQQQARCSYLSEKCLSTILSGRGSSFFCAEKESDFQKVVEMIRRRAMEEKYYSLPDQNKIFKIDEEKCQVPECSFFSTTTTNLPKMILSTISSSLSRYLERKFSSSSSSAHDENNNSFGTTTSPDQETIPSLIKLTGGNSKLASGFKDRVESEMQNLIANKIISTKRKVEQEGSLSNEEELMIWKKLMAKMKILQNIENTSSSSRGGGGMVDETLLTPFSNSVWSGGSAVSSLSVFTSMFVKTRRDYDEGTSFAE